MASALPDARGVDAALTPQKTRRRSSSLLGGEIPGDTSAPAISTSRSPAARQASRTRRRKLSKHKQHGQMIPGPDNFMVWYKEMSYRHTWANPLLAMLIIIAFYLQNPTPSNWAHDFIFVAYRTDEKGPNGETLYGKGLGDGKFLFFYTLFFTFTREFIMQRILYPISQKALPKATRRNKATIARFLEQSYTAIYFAFFGPLGLYVMKQTPGLWYFNTTVYWTSHPNLLHNAIFKAYYLLQWSYWLQQAIVLILMLEKPRKDFVELVIHHIVTVSLITLSWRFHFSYVGLSVFITHDISDFFLATSKVLNYVDSPITGPYFVVFIGSWVYLRHYLNLGILWSVFTEMPYVADFRLDWDEPYYNCQLGQIVISSLLSALQIVNIFWLYLVLRVAYRYVFKAELNDVRSEDEGGEGDEDDVGFDDDIKTPMLEETPKIQLNGQALLDSKSNGAENSKPSTKS
ncbi:hypothetical protein DRE_00734 [Drechslerella stenobrocha 248]|uniref:TLC domain-containing protein n=1 Tax=Drechslerella stenobrocha 248 TaxID=1043628 RepID=W7I8H9_9PEZI|nr:hypothetical protein DRE_00734 [Drechslerella stenobrocha 248]